MPVDGAQTGCSETGTTGVFTRTWTQATVSWDCNAQHGSIVRSNNKNNAAGTA